MKARGRKTTPKRRARNSPARAPAAAKPDGRIERLRRDLNESLAQQSATADVLDLISRTPGDPEPVFRSILANATRLCEAKFATLYLYDGDAFTTAAMHNAPAAYVKARQKRGPIRP